MKYHILLIFSIFTSSLLAQSSWSSLDNAPVNANGTRFDDVFFINSDLGWIANGANGNVFKTIDGGENWTKINDIGYTGYEFPSENVGYGRSSKIPGFPLENYYSCQCEDGTYKTTDGGVTWTKISDTVFHFFSFITFNLVI